MTIHKEGRYFLAIMMTTLIIINVLIAYAFPDAQVSRNVLLGVSVVLFLLFLQFFRLPRLVVQQNANHIIAPADGKIVVIEETVENEYLQTPCRQISIFMSPFNVHTNRMPIGGKIIYVKYHPGKFLMAFNPKSSTENERSTLAIRGTDGRQIAIRQIAGLLARRIRCYAREGDTLAQGDEFGFIKFGSRVDIFIPLSARVLVCIGEIAKGGKTIIAEW